MAKDKRSTFEDKLSQLNTDLKREPPRTPIQEVTPVKEKKAKSTHEGESHINFWVLDEVAERLKIHSAKTKKSIKDICTEALESYLPKY